MIQRRRVRSVEVEKAPRLRLLRPTPLGWRVWVKLHDGQVPEDYADVAERLAHACRVRQSTPIPRDEKCKAQRKLGDALG